MKVLLEGARTELNIKKSRFIAETFIVKNQAEAREKLHEQKNRYADARHVCHAFVTGQNGETSGMSDDGEPSGTAGRPMLDVLKGSSITNILVTVTRYFGGILLGTGGLVKAYGDSVKSVLSACKVEDLIEKLPFSFYINYSLHKQLKNVMENYHISDLKEEFASKVYISGTIWKSESQDFALIVKNLSKGAIKLFDA